jgi:ubiquinone/menaquinone biosynthesis C-methylase UbiE
MACTPSNHERIRWTLSLLDVQPGDRLLEIGFGPGFAIKLASELAPEGFVAGIDHSEVMVRQAQKRNASAIREGRVDLRHGSVSNPPTYDAPFDKIFSINSIQFWENPVGGLNRLRGLLKSGGQIAITFQPRHSGATDEDAERVGKEIVANLTRAGFSQIRLERRKMKPVSSVCVLGVK